MLNPFSLIIFIAGICFAMAGWLMHKFPPKQINSIYGYRTPRSMRRQESWKEGNRYSSGIMFFIGLADCFIGFMGIFFTPPELAGAISALALVLISAFLIIFMTEKRLKNRD